MATEAGLTVRHVCEVGVYLPETSNVLNWIHDGVRTTLVECDPLIVTKLRSEFPVPNVVIHDVAVSHEVGELTLYRTGASTFGANVASSPATVNDGYQPRQEDSFTVKAVTFDMIDDGTIDVLSIDIEGGEWNVLRFLVSRPLVICVETHGKRYENPHLTDIRGWMRVQGYAPWYVDDSDTAFRRGYDGGLVDNRRKKSAFQRIMDTLRGYK